MSVQFGKLQGWQCLHLREIQLESNFPTHRYSPEDEDCSNASMRIMGDSFCLVHGILIVYKENNVGPIQCFSPPPLLPWASDD